MLGRAATTAWGNNVSPDLGTLGGQNSQAYAINGLGQVLGRSDTADGGTHPFLWHRGRMVDLPWTRPATRSARTPPGPRRRPAAERLGRRHG